jgi:hypothetical protein
VTLFAHACESDCAVTVNAAQRVTAARDVTPVDEAAPIERAGWRPARPRWAVDDRGGPLTIAGETQY